MTLKKVVFSQQQITTLIRALLLALSAWLSFLIAVLLKVDNPYWAAMPIWVIAQSTRGLLIERALYRVVGTLLGAGAGLLILMTNQPIWELLLMAIVIFICAGGLHVLQGVRSYMALLSGITVAVVVLPALLAPDQALDLASARIESTLIGVIVGTIITGVGTPPSPRQQFYQQVRQLAADAVQTAVWLLTEQHPQKINRMLRKLGIRLSDLEAQAANTAAGSIEGHKRNTYVEALLFAALEILAAAQQLNLQIRRGMQISPEAIEQLEGFSYQFQHGLDLAPFRKQDPTYLTNKVSLARLRRALGQLKRAESALFGTEYSFWRRSLSLRRFNPARDWVTARRTATLCGGAALLGGLLAYLSQNPALELAATGICIFSLIIGSGPRPHIHARTVIVGVTIGAVFAALYRLGLQPYSVDPFWMVISLLPFMLVGAIARSIPSTAAPALDATMCFLLASQFGMPTVPFVEVIQGSGALIVGTSLVCGSFYFMPRHTDQWARVLIYQFLTEIKLTIQQRPPQAVSLWRARVSRQLLRLLQWMGFETPMGLLGLVNFGYSVIAWQRLTAANTHYEYLGVQMQPQLISFDVHPDKCHQYLIDLAANISDPTINAAIYDMADALNEAKPVLLFLYPSMD